MAKSSRASSRKRNNAALRSKIFGPASDARTERLSAKLQELASKARPDEERAMDVDDMPEALKEEDEIVEEAVEGEDMDVDAQGAKMKQVKKKTSTNKKAQRASKHRITKSKKPRNNIIFPDLQARKKRQAEANSRRKRS